LLPEIAPARGDGLQTVEVELPRARFAGQGTQGADLAIGSRNGIALCDIDIARSNTTGPPGDFGSVRLTIKDAATGRLVPARIGLYDETGRAPCFDQSLMLQRFAEICACLRSTNARSGRPRTVKRSTSTAATRAVCP
jgi:hypothetical protein